MQNGRCSNCQNYFKQVLGILDLRWPKEVRSNPIEDCLIAVLVESYSEFSFQTLISLRFQSSKLPEVIRGAYQQYAANPQSWSRQMLEMFQKRTSKRFHCTSKEIALDLGCGVGASSFILAKQFELVTGLWRF